MIKNSGSTNMMVIPSVRVILVNEFGSSTDVTKTLLGTTMPEVFRAIRECLAGCGYAEETLDEFFGAE